MPDLDFDLASVPEPESSFDLIPRGWYRMIVDASEKNTTKAGTGSKIDMTMTVLGPTHENRKLWASFNIENPNPKTVQIAREQLAQLAAACGKPNARTTEELHGIPFEGKVGIDPPQNGYEAKNKIVRYRPISSANSTPPVPAPRKPAPTSAPPAGVPWGTR